MVVRTLLSRWAAVIVVLGLGWLAVGETLADLLANAAPSIALTFRPGASQALEQRNQALFGTPQAVPTIAKSLSKAPLDAALLGQLAGQVQNQDAVRARAYLNLASEMTRRVPSVEQAIYYDALGAGNFPAAYQALDMLLRQRAITERLILIDLDAEIDDPRARDAFAKVLATSPPWRSSILKDWTQSTKKPQAVIALYDRLAQLGSAASPEERANLVQLMAAIGEYKDARAASGAGEGLLVDGDFKGASALSPFNWSLQPSGLVTAEISAASNGQRGLNVAWPANQTAQLTEQLTLLPPGDYRLAGLASVEKLANHGWVSWLLICASDQRQLGEARESAAAGWHDFSTVFTVPADCPAVWLRLSSLAGDGDGDGDGFASAWYQRLSITPISASEAAEARKSPF